MELNESRLDLVLTVPFRFIFILVRPLKEPGEEFFNAGPIQTESEECAERPGDEKL
ncbi:MAG: hypothetical protein ACC700_11960 [Anaerolineales bacterium]